MKVKITEAELISLIEKVIKENRLNEGKKKKKKKKGKKDKKWIQKAYASGDVKEDKLTDYCDGKVTCACVERALKSKGMKKGAQMYLNMNKSKCKSLKESIILEQLPKGIIKGSKEHADWVRSQQGGDKDTLLENLLTESQRLASFVEDARNETGNWTVDDLSSIQKNINTNITNYLAA